MCKIVVEISQVSQMSQESTCAGAFFNKVEKRLLWNLRNFENTLFSRGCFWQFQVSSLQLYWKRNSDKLVFSVNFAKFLSISFDRTSLDDCFLCLSVNFEKFFRTPVFIEHLRETAYFTYKLQNFNQQIQWQTISQLLFKYLI